MIKEQSVKSSLTVLLYSHNPQYVDRYFRLIKKARKHLQVFACKNIADISKNIGKSQIIFSGHTFPVELIPNAKRLRWIQSMSAGVERFVRSEYVPSQVLLTRVEGVFGPIMAEYVIAHILAVTQNMRTVWENQQKRAWRPFLVDSLRTKTVGVMGLGSIGAHVAYQLYLMGAEVIGLDEQAKKLPYVSREYARPDLEEFLGRSDFVVVTMPLTDATRGLLDDKQFEAMKKTACLVNISRGPIVREDALLNALKKGKIGGAILDVFETEPLPRGHEFWRMDNVLLSPHISGPSIPEDIAPIFIENIKRFEEGKLLHGLVDRERGF
ncbi:MAG: D-2-hydroxyacid dehydrogenase [Planctomycetes bacterium]|nr:D-2-hydroxyacid dehydrogenase [Planctomycetota bacterium]